MIPMSGQYEQQCNALAASKLGVSVADTIDDDFAHILEQWIHHCKPVEIDFPDETAQIVETMIRQHARPGKN